MMILGLAAMSMTGAIVAGGLTGCAAAGSRSVKGECLVVPVYYTTTRGDVCAEPMSQPSPKNPLDRFEAVRDKDGQVHAGTCEMRIRLDSLKCTQADRETVFKDARIETFGPDTVWVTLTPENAKANPPEGCFPKYDPKWSMRGKDVIVFVHGFNNSFHTAMERSAVLGSEVAAGQRMVCFSWASRCEAKDYLCDEATAEASERLLADFLERMEKAVGAEGGRVHIIAHSMGARLTCRALQRLALLGGHQFGHVVLAAPDVDDEQFRTTFVPDLFGNVGIPEGEKKATIDKLTVYKSTDDEVLWLSNKVHIYRRLGYGDWLPSRERGIDRVNVVLVETRSGFMSHSDDDPFGHAFFTTDRDVMRDMRQAILGEGPTSMMRCSSLTPALDVKKQEIKGVWELKHASKELQEGRLQTGVGLGG
jgi:pimeloyl-ACP methyl ester carboxylesterase